MKWKASLRAAEKKQERQEVERGPDPLLIVSAVGQKADQPPSFTRGRYQDKPISTVPKSYLTFLMDCKGVGEADQSAVRTEYWTRWFGCPTTDAQVRERIDSAGAAMQTMIEARFPDRNMDRGTPDPEENQRELDALLTHLSPDVQALETLVENLSASLPAEFTIEAPALTILGNANANTI